MMEAEADGVIIHDWRVFFMGHKGNMEATYTVNKGLGKGTEDKMREAYAKTAEKYLVTTWKEKVSEDEMTAVFNRKILTTIAGCLPQAWAFTISLSSKNSARNVPSISVVR